MTPDQIAAEVSARYGVAVSPSVVQLCPPRTFSEPTPIWCGKTRTLVYPDKDARAIAYRKAIWNGARKARAIAATPAMIERRDNVRTLHAEGLHNSAIAERLKVSSCTITKDMRLLGLVGNPPPYGGPTDAAKVQLATILRMRAEGASPRDVAALLGLKEETVRRHATRAGHAFPRPRFRSPRTGENNAAVLRLKAEGKTPNEISAVIGINAESVRRVAARAGDPFPPRLRLPVERKPSVARAEALQAKIKARHELVRQMVREGATRAMLCAATGVSTDTIRADMKAMGLEKLPTAAPPRRKKAVTEKPKPRPKKVRPRIDPSQHKSKIQKQYRQSRVKELCRQGFGFLHICAVLAAGKSTIHRDLSELGLITNSRVKVTRAA